MIFSFIKIIVFFYFCDYSNEASVQSEIIKKVQSQTPPPPTTFSTVKNSLDFEPRVISEKNKFVVFNGQAFIINKFSLSHNFSFNCQLKYLPIDFTLRHSNGAEKLVTAYMDENNNDELQWEQKIFLCRRVRRYSVDGNHSIIIVHKEIKLVDTSEIDAYIQTELLRTWDILTFLSYVLNLYDEKNDKTLFFPAVKNIVFYTIVFIHLFRISCKLYCIAYWLIKLLIKFIASLENLEAPKDAAIKKKK